MSRRKVAPFSGAVAFSHDGERIYVADTVGSDGALYVYGARSGERLLAKPGFNVPMQLCVAPKTGAVFVAEYGANCVRQLEPRTLADRGLRDRFDDDALHPPPFARINRPVGVCVSDDAVFVAASESSVDVLPCRATCDSIIAVFDRVSGVRLYVFMTRPHSFSGALCFWGANPWRVAMAGGDTRVTVFDVNGTFHSLFSRGVSTTAPSASFAPRDARDAAFACKTFSAASVPGHNVVLAAYGQTASIAVLCVNTLECLHVVDVADALRRVHNVAVNAARGIVALQDFDDGRLVQMPLSTFVLSGKCSMRKEYGGGGGGVTLSMRAFVTLNMREFVMYADVDASTSADVDADVTMATYKPKPKPKSKPAVVAVRAIGAGAGAGAGAGVDSGHGAASGDGHGRGYGVDAAAKYAQARRHAR